jgi:hypothetical protein
MMSSELYAFHTTVSFVFCPTLSTPLAPFSSIYNKGVIPQIFLFFIAWENWRGALLDTNDLGRSRSNVAFG